MKQLYVLSIGNSFSQDAQRYLHDLAAMNGADIECVNLYIGGCSMERHYRNMLGDKRDYELEMNGHAGMQFFTSIREALLARKWDVVTLQQASHESYDYANYEPYVKALADHVRVLCPTARVLIHETWGYESHSPRIKEHGFETFEEMFAKVEAAYKMAAEACSADGILYSGEVLLEAQKVFPKVHRDTFRASYGLGRYLLALTWYGTLFGTSVADVKYDYFMEPVSAEENEKAKEIVDLVLKRNGVIN